MTFEQSPWESQRAPPQASVQRTQHRAHRWEASWILAFSWSPKVAAVPTVRLSLSRQVVNNWDEIKESELACGRPCYSMKWLYLLFRIIWAPAEGWRLFLHPSYRWRGLTAAAIALWEVCVATTPELPRDLTPEPRALTWVCLKEPAGD